DDEYEDDEYEDDEYEDDEYEDDEYEDEDDEYEDDEYEENSIVESKSKTTKKLSSITNTNKTNEFPSIAAKTDRYTIQITSKRMLTDAQFFSQELIKKGYDVYIQQVILKNQEKWYRVRLGSYDNYHSANKAATILSKELGFNTWVDFVREEQ
ncbi:MAG: hypothetical protein CMG55_03205, partial [Candidatus Marinimicrobia bacterium]|nr:hypothetical protein [Candidatus Neomarinimicrobiota bacterium]